MLMALINTNSLLGGGISTDAGLTPAQDRWIVRMQYRHMGMESAMMDMNTQMVPVVLAYGITPAISVMTRAMYVDRSSNSRMPQKGMNDLFILSKFRLYRKNTAKYVLGIAPHIASNVPIGNRDVSPRTWNPVLGLNFSFRPRFFAIDVSSSYTLVDVSNKTDVSESNKFAINTAFSGQIPLKGNSGKTLSPVLELNYFSETSENENGNKPGGLFISPGLAYRIGSFSLEGLLQFPVYQKETGVEQTERLIAGVKYMF